jgi:hypothetical protein
LVFPNKRDSGEGKKTATSYYNKAPMYLVLGPLKRDNTANIVDA